MCPLTPATITRHLKIQGDLRFEMLIRFNTGTIEMQGMQGQTMCDFVSSIYLILTFYIWHRSNCFGSMLQCSHFEANVA